MIAKINIPKVIFGTDTTTTTHDIDCPMSRPGIITAIFVVVAATFVVSVTIGDVVVVVVCPPTVYRMFVSTACAFHALRAEADPLLSMPMPTAAKGESNNKRKRTGKVPFSIHSHNNVTSTSRHVCVVMTGKAHWDGRTCTERGFYL